MSGSLPPLAQTLIGTALSGHYQQQTYDTEHAYKQQWVRHFNLDFSPELLALQGGMLADRLAWLFCAGYQCAIRRTFRGIIASHWVALAISEDRSDTSPKPGVSMNSPGQLSGFKTWVAASEVIDDIVINIGSPPNSEFLLIDINRSGLTLRHKIDQKFLSEMSQGVAEFVQLQTRPGDYLETVDIRTFARREPLYLYIAYCGFLLAHTDNHFQDQVLDCLESLWALANGALDGAADRLEFARVDRLITEITSGLDHGAIFSGNWQDDLPLLTLYSKGIQKRALKKLATSG